MFGVDNNDAQTGSAPVSPPAAHPITGYPLNEPAQTAAPAVAASGANGLLELKQRALASLEPMVSKLDQSPEDKFRTLMMLIQSSDNSGLLNEAYATAEKITDERARAQALIDVVNEINYFTQKA